MRHETQENSLRSWIGRNSIVKMTLLPNAFYNLNAMLIISMPFLKTLSFATYIYWKQQRICREKYMNIIVISDC